MNTRLMTLKETTETLGVSRTTLYNLIRKGDLKVVHVRGCKRVATTDLNAYIERLREDN